MSFTIHHRGKQGSYPATAQDHNIHELPPVGHKKNFGWRASQRVPRSASCYDLFLSIRSYCTITEKRLTGVFLPMEAYVLLPIQSSQQAEWDTFVANHPQGHLLQSWSWGELKAGPDWHPLRLALRETQTGKIVAGAQVLRRTALHVPLRLGHLAYVPKGPLLDWRTDGASLMRLFLQKLHTFMRAQGALALQIEPNLHADSVEGYVAASLLQVLGFRYIQTVQPARTILLDLKPDEETLLANMKEKWRYNVRLAARKGVEVRAAQSIEELRAWYELLQTTRERDQFGIHTFDYYRKAWEMLVPRQQARLFLAWAEHELLAGIFVSLLGHEAIYLYGASSNARRNLMPNYLLQWEAIRWARQAGADIYDFWGIPASDNADEAMAGVYRFKSGWGGNVVSFVGNYEYVYHPLLTGIAKQALG
jgi:lipid II:glycine glycyltransferase (peptidoglycan interpeptide bridge formation enzyme)